MMKVLNSLRTAKNAIQTVQIVKRKGRLYVICKSNPRFKAVQVVRKNVDLKFDELTIFV